MRKPRCVHGHALTPGNTRIDRRGHQECIACERRRCREYRARRRARAKPVEQRQRHGPRPSKSVAAVMCDAEGSLPWGDHASHVAITRFTDVEAAVQFAARLPCENVHCARLHVLVWRYRQDSSRLEVRIFGQPPVLPLAEALAEAGYQTVTPNTGWIIPPDLNEPLGPPRSHRTGVFKT